MIHAGLQVTSYKIWRDDGGAEVDERRRAAEASLRGAEVELVGRRGHDPALRVRGIVMGAVVVWERRGAGCRHFLIRRCAPPSPKGKV